MPTRLLVNGASAKDVEQATGLRAYDTPLGTLVEEPRPFDLDAVMAALERSLRPIRCSCGHGAIMHWPSCPMAYGVV